MQALRVHAFDQPLRLDSLPTPEPAAGEARVRVQACGISFFDLLIARGGYQWRPGLPFTVGSEFAGVVEALGPGTRGLAVGDRVGGSVSIGAWTQQLCALHWASRSRAACWALVCNWAVMPNCVRR
jgi:NADPH2:quinone reductase